ncbi:hypothetical protein [Streptomyces sp. ICBB 8177]|uniref:hypothetical protein n=1 Tax=Streptomyces sp. ICBB 8177 TaxID=563922 RepID=UPI0011B42BFA|nr:hypothetical protein [Streptomyces sp. ICBB 8177]
MSTVSDILENYARDWSIDATPVITVQRTQHVGILDVDTLYVGVQDSFSCSLEGPVTPGISMQESRSEAPSLLADIAAHLTPFQSGGRQMLPLWTFGTAEAFELVRRELRRRLDPFEHQADEPAPVERQNKALVAIEEMSSWLGVTAAKAADLAGGYRRSYYNWLKGMVPYDATTLNLFEAHAFIEALVDVLEPRGVREWLNVPYGSGVRIDLLRDSAGRAVLSGLARSILFREPEPKTAWLPDDDLAHTPPPAAERSEMPVRRVQMPKKGYRK